MCSLLSHVNKRVPKWLFLLANDSIKLYGLEVKNLRLIRRRRERETRGVTTAKCNFWGVPTLPYVFLDIVHPTKRLYFAIIVYCASAALLSSVAQFGIFWQHCHFFCVNIHGMFETCVKNCQDFCPTHYRAEILTIFRSYFWGWVKKVNLKFTDI